MILVSIIIPTYNVEAYIIACLDSVCQQSYKDIEIIIVDDASTDMTVDLIEKYAKQDSRINLIIQKMHCGNGVGRNIGIHEAKGKYIMFVDADDTIVFNAVEDLMGMVSQKATQVVFYGYKERFFERSGKEKFSAPILPQISGRESPQALLALLLVQQKKLNYAVWTYFCNREFLIYNNIFFDESGKFFEDVIFTVKLFYFIERIAVLRKALYYYTIRRDSIMGSITKKSITDRVDVFLGVKFFLKSQNVFTQYRDAYTFCFVHSVFLLPFMDYVRMKETDKEVHSFLYDLSKSDVVRNFDPSHLALPQCENDKEFERRYRDVKAEVWLVSHHFKFSLWFYRLLFKICR